MQMGQLGATSRGPPAPGVPVPVPIDFPELNHQEVLLKQDEAQL